MDTFENGRSPRRRRRTHSAEFKSQVVAACRQAGMSMAAVALEHQLNANLLRRWVIEDERLRQTSLIAAGNAAGAKPLDTNAGFVPVEISSPAVRVSQEIVIELRRGATTVKVNWPLEAAAACSLWLRGLLR